MLKATKKKYYIKYQLRYVEKLVDSTYKVMFIN